MVPGVLLAQPGHWRVTLQGGVARGYNHLQTDRPLPDRVFRIPNRAGAAFQLGLERSLTPRFGVRASFGVVNHRMGTEQRTILRDTVTNFVIAGVSRSSGNLGVMTGSLGATLNSRAYGRVIFTVGSDLVARLNPRSDVVGWRWGGAGGLSFGSQRVEQVYLFPPPIRAAGHAGRFAPGWSRLPRQ